MRATRSLLATIVKGKGTHLHAHTPTGLTGLFTHPSPRPHLVYLYNQTLARLAQLPEESVYRQSTEALTKHRLAIIEAAVPAGLSEWQQRISALADQPENTAEKQLAQMMMRGKGYLPQRRDERDDRYIEWGDDTGEERMEGPRVGDQLAFDQGKEFGAGLQPHEIAPQHIYVEDEPSLSIEQISEVEHKIGSGLIEEVVNVAQGELQLVNEMREAKVWEELSEKPAEGQWDYFQRDRHTGSTQAP